MHLCSICNSEISEFKTLYDDRYGFPGYFTIGKCISCGHKILLANFTPEEIQKLYTNYYPRSTTEVAEFRPHQEIPFLQSWWNGDRSQAFRWVPTNVTVLDIGCGFGETLAYHEKRGCDAYGIEADQNALRTAVHYGLNIKISLFDGDCYPSNFFDFVTMDQVIEHVTDPIKVLLDIHKVLKPNGMLVLSTPNSGGWGSKVFRNAWINWHVPYHLHFFSKDSMGLAAKKAGFDLLKVCTMTYSGWLGHQWIHLYTRPTMGTPSVHWAPDLRFTSYQKKIVTILEMMGKLQINRILTRIFDLIGCGDNYIFILKKR